MTQAMKRAIKKYEKKISRKNVVFRSDNDSDLIEAIGADSTPFSGLVKELLRVHYGIDRARGI